MTEATPAAPAPPDDFVVWLPLKDLEPHPENDQLHPDRQVEHLRARFRRQGWYKNLVVARHLGRLTILAGHGIAEAAAAVGALEAPCHVRDIDPMSDEAIDILTGDNASEDLAGYDDELRARHLGRLDDAGLLLGSGVDEFELDGVLRRAAQLEAPPPGSEPPAPPVLRCPRCGSEEVQEVA